MAWTLIFVGKEGTLAFVVVPVFLLTIALGRFKETLAATLFLLARAVFLADLLLGFRGEHIAELIVEFLFDGEVSVEVCLRGFEVAASGVEVGGYPHFAHGVSHIEGFAGAFQFLVRIDAARAAIVLWLVGHGLSALDVS